MTGLVAFLLLFLIVLQSRLLQELLGTLVLVLLAALAYGYYMSAPVAEQAPAPPHPAPIQVAPDLQVPEPPASSPAGRPGRYNFDPAPRPYRQQ